MISGSILNQMITPTFIKRRYSPCLNERKKWLVQKRGFFISSIIIIQIDRLVDWNKTNETDFFYFFCLSFSPHLLLLILRERERKTVFKNCCNIKRKKLIWLNFEIWMLVFYLSLIWSIGVERARPNDRRRHARDARNGRSSRPGPVSPARSTPWWPGSPF